LRGKKEKKKRERKKKRKKGGGRGKRCPRREGSGVGRTILEKKERRRKKSVSPVFLWGCGRFADGVIDKSKKGKEKGKKRGKGKELKTPHTESMDTLIRFHRERSGGKKKKKKKLHKKGKKREGKMRFDPWSKPSLLSSRSQREREGRGKGKKKGKKKEKEKKEKRRGGREGHPNVGTC